jgi:cytoskeletal protein CcmA (bactofilin family)
MSDELNKVVQLPELEDGPEADESGSVTAGMTISGDITSEGSLEVIGCVKGNINVRGKLNVSGSITGNSKASEVFADSAKITGELISKGAVKVGQESVIIGNITATSAVIAGAVKGDIDVRGPVILDTSAIVMGDIKSKSVQINNGAVVEGHCSQCYAEISPTSFFDELKNAVEARKDS